MRNPVAILAILTIPTHLACDPCMSRGQGGAYEECRREREYEESDESKAQREAQRQRAAEKLARHRREERAKYDAAVPPCKRGEPEPCLVIAKYGMANKHDAREIDGALEVACNGKVAEACFVRGRRRGGLAWYERACALDHVEGCVAAAAAADKPRETAFTTRACELHDYASCEKLGLAYADHDRAQAEKYLKLACNGKRRAACRRLGELTVKP